jgi:hypothetical protein
MDSKCNCGHQKEDHFNTIYSSITEDQTPFEGLTNCSECSCPKFIEAIYEWDGRTTKLKN